MSTGRMAPPTPGSTSVPVPPSDHGHSTKRWPLRDAITLGALDGAVPSARARVRQLLWEWDYAELAEDASVVVSELVTNAVIASAELRPAIAPMRVWLGSDTTCVLVAVADASPRPPVLLKLAPDAEGGRGLALVDALSTRWGWYPVRPASAGPVKVVWAEWHLRPPANEAGLDVASLPALGHSPGADVLRR
jgi:anti-sigma regulatory factor (Ser/Thr protein kinase)